jgi:hemolysin activation/secretion protein
MNRFRQPPEPTPAPVTPSTISVTRIDVAGSTVFNSADFASILQPLEGKPVTLQELQSAADAITQLYIDRGYVTSGAVLPQQDVTNGVVVIQVVEGLLERIDVEGTQMVDPNDIRQIVQRGVSVPLNVNSLESQLQSLKADSRFTTVEASLNPGTQAGQSILVIRVTEANNSGTSSSGGTQGGGIQFLPPATPNATRTGGATR